MQQKSQARLIGVLLATLGLDVATLAKETRVERTALSKVLNFTRSNPTIRAKAADAIAAHVRQLILDESNGNGQ